jgi:hypothetical protein
VRCPSPHNVQPWRLRVHDESHAELLIERARTLPDEDVEGSFIVLTMGMFVEHLDLVAAHAGRRLDARLLTPLTDLTAAKLRADARPFVPFAELHLEPAPGRVAEVPMELFAARATSRLAYRPDPVPWNAAEALRDLARAHAHELRLVTDPATIERVLALNTHAVIHDLNHRPYREEMGGWIRYTESASLRHRDGLDARCMNAAPAELWFVFHAPALMRWPGFGAWFRRRYRDQIGPVTTLGLLSGPFWDPRAAFPTGRFLVRFWLECARHGLSLHPYGNLVTNRPVAAEVERETGARDTWLVFKLGTSEPAPASRRRSVEEVLLA